MAAGTRPGCARLSPLESGLAARIGCPTEQASTLVSTRHARVRAPQGDEVFAVWSYELAGDGDAVFGGEPEVVGDDPEPAGVGIIAVGLDGAHGDGALAGLAYVGGRFDVDGAHFNGVGGEAGLESVDAGIGLKLNPGAETVAVEDGRLQEAERRHGSVLALAG